MALGGGAAAVSTSVLLRQLRGPRALTAVGDAYDRLAASTDLPVTSRRRWLQAWTDTFPQWSPWLVALEQEGRLVAVAPLAFRTRAWGMDVVLLGHGPTDDARLPAEPGQAERLARAVVHVLPAGGWRLRLNQVPRGDDVVRALCERLDQVEVTPGQGMPHVRAHGRDLDAHLSRNTRKALAKIRNRLRARGLEPAFRWTSDAADVEVLLPDLARVHRERDLSLGRLPEHDAPSVAAFYREVLLRHARAGELELLTLHLDGDLAAYVCGFRDGRTFRVWDNRLSPRWAAVSAGRLANTEALRRVVMGDDYDVLDWMRGEEPYKLQSATEVVPTSVVTAWSSPVLARVDRLLLGAEDRGRRVLRQAPGMLALHRRLRAVAARPPDLS
jgi:CelD/BcsL family acetyltransferase involved in cellulose biosynthesis